MPVSRRSELVEELPRVVAPRLAGCGVMDFGGIGMIDVLFEFSMGFSCQDDQFLLIATRREMLTFLPVKDLIIDIAIEEICPVVIEVHFDLDTKKAKAVLSEFFQEDWSYSSKNKALKDAKKFGNKFLRIGWCAIISVWRGDINQYDLVEDFLT